MIGQQVTTSVFGSLTIKAILARGGEGIVYETNDPSALIKVYDPEIDPGTSQTTVERNVAQKRTAYATFVNLNFTGNRSLRCLPLEYVHLPNKTPSYAMARADGSLLTNIINTNIQKKPIKERIQIAHALTDAIAPLHSRAVVHADIKPENFFVASTQGGYGVYVLDIDGGGYYGPDPQRFKPTAVPYSPYRSPELVFGKWNSFGENASLAMQPDLWALAVLIYNIVVDADGPFCSRPQRTDLAKYGYKPYGSRDFAKETKWPQDWQYHL